MSDYLDDIDRLMEEADSLGFGSTQVSLLEEAVRLADTHDDLDEGYRTRQELMTAATFAERPDLLLVAFSWCLAQHDRDPERFAEQDLLWKFKWVINRLPEFPQISREQIDGLWEDMKRRFERAGSSMHAVYHKRRDMLESMGDFAGAEQADAEMNKLRRDWLSDCFACVLDQDIEYHALFGRDEQALARAAPLLAGRYQCAEVPHRTYARVLLPLLRLGRAEEAMAWHKKGYRLIASNPEFNRHVAMHIVFLTLTDNLAKASKLFEKHLPDALQTPSLSNRFDYYLACRLLLDRLAEQDKEMLKLRLPAAFPRHEAAGRYSVLGLLSWFDGELRDLARRFDARNGNDFYSRRIADLDKLKKLVTPCPLVRKTVS